jgi:hypothetical protein
MGEKMMFTLVEIEFLLEIVEHYQDRYCYRMNPTKADEAHYCPDYCAQVKTMRKKLKSKRALIRLNERVKQDLKDGCGY